MVDQRRAGTSRERASRRAVPGAVAARLTDNSLTKKASLNVLAQGIEYTARVVAGLFLNPLLLTRLGDVVFGVWQFLQQLIGHVGPAGGRPGEALKWVTAHEQDSTDVATKRRHVGDAVAVWVLFLPFVCIVGGLLAWFAPRWLHVPAVSVSTVHAAASLLVVNLALQGVAYLPQSVLQGENLGYKRVGLSTTLVFVGAGLTIVVLLAGFGIVGLSVATIITTCISGAVTFWIARTQVSWFGIGRPTVESVRSFVGLSWWFLLWNLVMQLMRASDIVVLGIAGSAKLVTNYTLARYIPEAVTAGVAILIFSIMPGLGGLIGKRDLDRAASVRTELMVGTWFVSTVASAGVLLLESSFLQLWVGPGHYPGTVAMLLMVVVILQWGLIRTDSNIIDLTLRLRWKVLLGLISAGLSAGLAWVLLEVFDLGIPGLAIGFIVGRGILSVAYPVMIGRLLAISPGSQLRGCIRPGVTTVLLLGATALIGRGVHITSWPAFALATCVSGVVIAAIVFRAGVTANQRKGVVRRFREVVKR